MFDKCCQCAKKHLRAALAYAAHDPRPLVPWPAPQSPVGLYSRAAVLLRERFSYPRHVDLALGYLVMAEDLAAAAGMIQYAEELRTYRIGAEGDSLLLPPSVAGEHLACGHLAEAFREGVLSEPPDTMTSRLFKDEWFDKWIKEVERAEKNG